MYCRAYVYIVQNPYNEHKTINEHINLNWNIETISQSMITKLDSSTKIMEVCSTRAQDSYEEFRVLFKT